MADKGKIDNNNKEIRLDKFLVLSQKFKHRSDAVSEINSGKLKVNGQRVKPAKMVKIGDELTYKVRGKYIKYVIKDIVFKNITKEESKALFEDPKGEILNKKDSNKENLSSLTKELKEIIDQQDEQNRLEQKHQGKPDKKSRRILSKYKYNR